MTSMHSHICFNGNCREAMLFYQSCLGGELQFQTVGDETNARKLPSEMKAAVLQAQLKADNIILMASDLTEQGGLIKGNAISLVLQCVSGREAKDLYRKLSQGGRKTYPLQKNHWGELFGLLEDKFGIAWQVGCTQKNT
jgi:PhnB protein